MMFGGDRHSISIVGAGLFIALDARVVRNRVFAEKTCYSTF